MIKPKSELPWKVIKDNTAGIYDIKGDCFLITDEYYKDEDLDYIIHCCNNYPKAIELLEKINDYYDLEHDFKDKRVEMDIHFEIEDFLKEIK
jgi:hypoxanthine phosphoribosyltransferase